MKKPTTYISYDPDIKILDENKFFFYAHPNSRLFIVFNLPPGCYYTNNTLNEQEIFQPYAMIPGADIPAPEDEVKNVKFILMANPHKASIYPGHGIIIMDHGMNLMKYIPAKAFVLGHELGHNYFGPDEDKCDDYSWNVMNRAGFNPSQAYIAASVLFVNSPARLQRFINNLQQLNSRR